MKPTYIIRFEIDERINGYRRITSILVGPGPQDRANKEKDAQEWMGNNPNRKWIAGGDEADIKLTYDGEIEKLTEEEYAILNPPPEPTTLELLTDEVEQLNKIVEDLIKRVEKLEKPNG